MAAGPRVRPRRTHQERRGGCGHRGPDRFLSLVLPYGVDPPLRRGRRGEDGHGHPARGKRLPGGTGTPPRRGVRRDTMNTAKNPGPGSGIGRLPAPQQETLRKAVRYEWITIGSMIIIVIMVGLVAGQSQAMKSAWSEDIISLVPPIAFLVATRIIHRVPTRNYPYGPHRAIAVAHLVA